MDAKVKAAIFSAVEKEPFAQTLGISLVKLEDGISTVEMVYLPEKQENIYSKAHGGAVYGLIDEAFETASQTGGTIAVALNVNVTYIASPEPYALLRAEARRISQSRKTANYAIKVSQQDGALIATCQALAYRTGKPIPFL